MRKLLFGFITVVGPFLASAQPTNTPRQLTLEECVQLALAHNFDVRIERYSPEISRFNLESANAAYIPEVQGSVVHASDTQESGGFIPGTTEPIPSRVSESTRIDAGIAGATPFGLTYDFSPDLIYHSGSRGGASFDPFYDGQAGINLRQPLLRNFLIDQRRQNILVAKKNLNISEQALTLRMMEVVNRVEQAYYDLVFSRENIKVQQAANQLAERLVVENRKKVEVGTLAPLEEKQAESQLAISRSDMLEAQQLHLAQQNALKTLLTDDYFQWHDVEIVPSEKLLAVPEAFDVMDSWQRGLAKRPELQQLRTDLERRDILLRYQRNQILPSVDLVGSYGNNGLDPKVGGVLEDEIKGRYPFYSVGVVLSFPLSTKGPRNAYKATKAEREQATLRLQKLEQDIMVQIDDAIKRAQTSFQRVDATRKAREYAEAALQAEQRKLEAGKSTSFVVLQLQRDLTAARSSGIRALTDYNKAQAQQAFSEGSSLERNRLRMAPK